MVLVRRGPLHVTAWLFWQVVIGVRSTGWVSNGLRGLLVFTMAMQSVFLSVLLTFARTPWYSSCDDEGDLEPGAARRPAAGRSHHVDPSRR
jgi:Cytochrome c oxidase caa3 assembly factor (Caa3_CtaG)